MVWVTAPQGARNGGSYNVLGHLPTLTYIHLRCVVDGFPQHANTAPIQFMVAPIGQNPQAYLEHITNLDKRSHNSPRRRGTEWTPFTLTNTAKTDSSSHLTARPTIWAPCTTAPTRQTRHGIHARKQNDNSNVTATRYHSGPPNRVLWIKSLFAISSAVYAAMPELVNKNTHAISTGAAHIHLLLNNIFSPPPARARPPLPARPRPVHSYD